MMTAGRIISSVLLAMLKEERMFIVKDRAGKDVALLLFFPDNVVLRMHGSKDVVLSYTLFPPFFTNLVRKTGGIRITLMKDKRSFELSYPVKRDEFEKEMLNSSSLTRLVLFKAGVFLRFNTEYADVLESLLLKMREDVLKLVRYYGIVDILTVQRLGSFKGVSREGKLVLKLRETDLSLDIQTLYIKLIYVKEGDREYVIVLEGDLIWDEKCVKHVVYSPDLVNVVKKLFEEKDGALVKLLWR